MEVAFITLGISFIWRAVLSTFHDLIFFIAKPLSSLISQALLCTVTDTGGLTYFH